MCTRKKNDFKTPASGVTTWQIMPRFFIGTYNNNNGKEKEEKKKKKEHQGKAKEVVYNRI